MRYFLFQSGEDMIKWLLMKEHSTEERKAR